MSAPLHSASPDQQAQIGRLELLDYARFAAAFAVMLFHYLLNGIHNGKINSLTLSPDIVPVIQYGYLGVEFFFMISGYVIFFSARGRSASAFAVSRAIRLYPAYWCAICITSIVAQFWGHGEMQVTLQQALVNLGMFPGLFDVPYVDGVYWTLGYELSFYMMVLLMLLAGQQQRLHLWFLAWPLLMLVALAAERGYLPFLGNHYAYFSAGAAFAIAREKRSWAVMGALACCLLLCLQFSTGKAATMSASKGVEYSGLMIGVIVVFMFAFFAVLNTRAGSTLRLPASRLIGDLTYPWYLIHAHFGYMFLSRFAEDEHKFAWYGLTIILVLVMSYAINQYVEKMAAPLWRRVFTLGLRPSLDWLQARLRTS